MSALYNFSLDKTRALLLAGCFAAAAILLFFAGSLSGILYSGHLGSNAATTRVVQAPALPKPMQAHATSQPAAAAAPSSAVAAGPAGTPTPAASATAASSNSAAPATPAPAPPASVAASAPSAAAATTPPSAVASAKPQPAALAAAPKPVEASSSYAIPLAVRVGSFSVKANAETLMQSLKDLGYRPSLSLYSDPHERTWYVVKLGPYTRWNKASQVAARVSIAENVKPVIGPMGPIQ